MTRIEMIMMQMVVLVVLLLLGHAPQIRRMRRHANDARKSGHVTKTLQKAFTVSGRVQRHGADGKAHRAGRATASLRAADAAKICDNIRLIRDDGFFECSVAEAATRG